MADVAVGVQVPDFEAPSQTGETVKLSDYLARGPVVLFFYPKAMTPGCTKENCHFRDLQAEFDAVGATRLGISADKPDLQAKFASRYDLDFPLLSDTDGSIARAFGASRRGPLFNRRVSFVIGADGKLLDIIKSELNMQVHADKALEILKSIVPTRVLDEPDRHVRLDESPKVSRRN
jgi:thioredoxin-dependent peroxiredoxin